MAQLTSPNIESPISWGPTVAVEKKAIRIIIIIIITLFRIHLDRQQETDWDLRLSGTLYNLRRRCNAAIGVSPSVLLFGRDLQLSGEWDMVGPNHQSMNEPSVG